MKRTFAASYTIPDPRSCPEDSQMTPLEERIDALHIALREARECGDNNLYNEIWDEIHALERMEMQAEEES